MSSFKEFLTAERVRQVHEASLQVLDDVGMLVRNPRARERFSRHGCRVDEETQVVRFPPDVVEDFRQAIPPTFTFYGRDPRYDRTVPDDRPLMITGSAAPDIIDPETGEKRRARSDDIARIAFLINELPGYDVLGIPVTADDAPADQFSMSRFYPALKNCRKPVRGSAPSLKETEEIIRLCTLIAGSEGAFWERPFVTFHHCAVVSPLTMDVESTEKLMVMAEKKIPAYDVVAPNAGVTAPFSLLGALVLCNAEFLAQSVLAQMSRPGTPVVYEPLPTVADLRTGAYAPGGIETGMLLMGVAQMARFYHLPSGGFVGLTNAKTNDAQAGFETGMSTVAAALAGLDVLTAGGVLDALMAFDFAKAVIDSEVALMLKHLERGLEFDAAHPDLDVIAQVGPGGMYMDHPHTLKRMRKTALLPEIADRTPWDQWQQSGAPNVEARAMRRVRAILSQDNPAVLSPDVDARIRAQFQDLVAGNAGRLFTQ
jgi:trimethylamine--corrinoid protein Co-methyltransferase